MRQAFDVIARYAVAYNEFENIQGDNATAPFAKGDQKTGVIAEYYGKLFAQREHPNAKVSYAGHSTNGFDLLVQEPGSADRRIQVKAVSAHSVTGRVSPIHSGWTHLYLIRLDKGFQPVGFWVMTLGSFRSAQFPLLHRTMPEDGKPRSGSVEFSGRVSRLSELREVLHRAMTEAPRRS
jgi:hypothetical protein